MVAMKHIEKVYIVLLREISIEWHDQWRMKSLEDVLKMIRIRSQSLRPFDFIYKSVVHSY